MARTKINANVKKPAADLVTPKATLPPADASKLVYIIGDHGDRPANNIKYSGRPEMDKGKRKIVRPNDPIELYSDAGRIVRLPSADFQKRVRLFYHEAAGEIVAAFPHLYKRIRPKN